MIFGKTHPSICPHEDLSAHSDFYGAYVHTKAACKVCGVKITVQIPTKRIMAQDVPALTFIELTVQKLMKKAVRQKVQTNKLHEVKNI